jgi:hypothetical protein
MTASEQFRQWIPTTATEQHPVKAGNVEFWWAHGRLCWDLPTARWDTQAVTAQLVKWAQEQQQ